MAIFQRKVPFRKLFLPLSRQGRLAQRGSTQLSEVTITLHYSLKSPEGFFMEFLAVAAMILLLFALQNTLYKKYAFRNLE